jgi:hypothetical protein
MCLKTIDVARLVLEDVSYRPIYSENPSTFDIRIQDAALGAIMYITHDPHTLPTAEGTAIRSAIPESQDPLACMYVVKIVLCLVYNASFTAATVPVPVLSVIAVGDYDAWTPPKCDCNSHVLAYLERRPTTCYIDLNVLISLYCKYKSKPRQTIVPAHHSTSVKEEAIRASKRLLW